ncbi:MAG: hypothetical protein H8D39_03055 [Candidatus Atribacteria bacterium]|nr:hypothetical protein [Candidatus Atribacteria bacterium]
MDEEKELTISINEANSLKKIVTMPGWKIIKDFLDKSEEKYDKELKSEENNDLANIKACRKIIGWIRDFRDLFEYTEIAAYQDEQDLKIIKGEGGKREK